MKVNGHELLVEQYGPDSGPVVVLLHHGLGSIKAWRKQIPVLVNGGYCVVVYDRWGYGGSDVRPGLDLPSFNTDLDDLYSLLEQLRIKQTALVGHSDGGTIAMYFAARYPGRVSCLVTIAAHAYIESKMEPALFEIKRAFEIDERFRKGMQYAHGEKFETVFDNWFYGWYRIESLSWDMRLTLGNIRCPVLVVQGEKDEHASPQHAIDIANAIHGAELWLVPEAMHMLPQDYADNFNSRLLNFLKKHAVDNR